MNNPMSVFQETEIAKHLNIAIHELFVKKQKEKLYPQEVWG